MQQPTLHTSRLLLRPFHLEDAPEVQHLAGAFEIARVTLNVPHPYEDGMAQAWIESHASEFEKGLVAYFALVEATSNALIGSMHLRINRAHAHAELGYWLGVPFWNRGYATEAARTLLHYGFESLELQRIQASHLGCNPASGRVMQKIGMQPEGVSRRAARKWDEFHDLVRYAILREEYVPPTPGN